MIPLIDPTDSQAKVMKTSQNTEQNQYRARSMRGFFVCFI